MSSILVISIASSIESHISVVTQEMLFSFLYTSSSQQKETEGEMNDFVSHEIFGICLKTVLVNTSGEGVILLLASSG